MTWPPTPAGVALRPRSGSTTPEVGDLAWLPLER
jgi:hypothetical protein